MGLPSTTLNGGQYSIGNKFVSRSIEYFKYSTVRGVLYYSRTRTVLGIK